MKKINIIGRGNVATHLYEAFKEKTSTVMVNPHSLEFLDTDADFVLIAVSDNAISEIAAKLPAISGIVAHTSGSTALDTLSAYSGLTGVFYPLQTFTKGINLDYSEIPFFIEGCDEETTRQLCELASLVSDNVRRADSKQRRALHVAAVFGCNFANHLWSITDDILKANGMDFDVIRPLLKETLRKTEALHPSQAQTGPASRHDTKTIEAHLAFLNNDNQLSRLCNLYSTLSDSIMSESDG